jgi:hypothetical protein
VSAGEPPSGPGIARAWQVWAAENLLRGASPEEITARLESEGVPREAVATLLDEVTRSPAFAAARPLALEARRLAMLSRLRRRLDRCASEATSIPRRAGLAPIDLRDLFYAANTPVILTDWVGRWPAFGRWTPATLRERFGDVEVGVTLEREADPDYDMRHEAHTRPLPLARLLDMIEQADGPTNDFYMVANNRVLERTALGSLLAEVTPPEELIDRKRLLGGSALWLGPAGTVTPLHHDTSNILFCQMHGRKRFHLVPPHETVMADGARAMYASVDAAGAAAAGALVREAVLAPGEALFIPVGWWHEVRALDASISIAFNAFTLQNDFDWYVPGKLT